MSSRRKQEKNKPANRSQHDKLLHAMALTIFSDSEVEAAAALSSLLQWSNSLSALYTTDPNNTLPKPTPILVISLARFLTLHMNEWEKGPSIDAGMTVLTIISNLLYSQQQKINVENAVLFASCNDMMVILQRISFHPTSPLAKLAKSILLQIAKFCDIQKVIDNPEKFTRICCSLFRLADPAVDEKQIMIFLSFALLQGNCSLFIEKLGASAIVSSITSFMGYPSVTLRDALLEYVYALCAVSEEFKEAICKSDSFLRRALGLCIPPFEPHDSHDSIPFSPCQKACVLMIELLEDSRVLSFVAGFKLQLATAVLKWHSAWLTELATRVSNAAPRM